jgi:hypothetical protein
MEVGPWLLFQHVLHAPGGSVPRCEQAGQMNPHPGGSIRNGAAVQYALPIMLHIGTHQIWDEAVLG